MGAIEVSLSDPNVIYAGTGSSKIRSNVSIGRGIYKSTDAGKTWTFAGLRDVGQISTMRVHPTNPDIVWVAALGNPFADNPERGVYRTTDGGANWKKVLYISDSAGAADLELQPGSPNVVFACMWHRPAQAVDHHQRRARRRHLQEHRWRRHWTKLAGGLPNELFGRSNVAISAAAPNRIYALIEAKPGSGLYRSEDAGATWSARQRRRATSSPGPSTTTRSASTPTTPTWSRSATKAGSRAPTAARVSAPRPSLTATITMSGSIPKTRSS